MVDVRSLDTGEKACEVRAEGLRRRRRGDTVHRRHVGVDLLLMSLCGYELCVLHIIMLVYVLCLIIMSWSCLSLLMFVLLHHVGVDLGEGGLLRHGLVELRVVKLMMRR